MFQYIPRPQTFTEMRRAALDFDQRHWERQEEAGRSQRTNPDKSESVRKTGNEQKATAPANPTSTKPPASHSSTASHSAHPPANRAPHHHNHAHPHPNPATSAKAETRGPLSQTEKDRRRAEGLCLYCGEKGHFHASCPKLPSNRSSAAGRATFVFTPSEEKLGNPTAAQEVKEES